MRPFLWMTLLGFGCNPEESGTVPTPTSSSTDPTLTEEDFVQSGWAASDVLVVTDADRAEDVLRGLPMILEYGGPLDWHVGLTSTGLGATASEVGLVTWFQLPNVPDPGDILATFAPVPGPDGAMGATRGALDVLDATSNAGFRRGHPLHILVVSDSDDATPNGDPAAFQSWLQGLSADVTFSAWVPASATVYRDLAAAMGGLTSDIDTDPPAAILGEFGLQATGLAQTFELSDDPVPGTVSVVVAVDDTVVEFEEGTDWSLTGRTIAFVDFVPRPGATIRVRYEPQP